MAVTPQSKFDVTLPTQDNATPPDTLAAGQITSLTFVVNGVSYTWPVPAGTAAGAALVVPFSALTPAFAPVPGTAYSADVEAVDANGVGLPSTPMTSWTQAAPVPLAPALTVA